MVRVKTNVRSLTQKLMIPKCSNLVYEMTLGYPRLQVIGFWVERSKVKVIGLGLTVIRREIELCESLLVI